jgi:SWI/SNF-related matrix-associated actin-dependent regulator of chromatin subfamily A-like protein 1
VNNTLYEHQTAGAAWLAGRARAYLGDTPGVGKTRTLLAALKPGDKPLIVCPAIVRTHWQREAEIVCPDIDIRVKSYDEIVRGGNALLKELVPQINVLVPDEAHFLKHTTSKRTKMLLGRDGYARRIERVYPASGTPMPRNPAELFPVLAALFPEVLLKRGIKTYEQFVERYCTVRGSYVRGQWREKIVGVKLEALDELQSMLPEFMLRRTLDDVGLDVPRIQWQLMLLDGGGCELSLDEQHRVEDYITLEALDEIAADPHVARMRRRLGELKAPLVVEMLRGELDADPTMRVAVFAHHRSVLGELHRGLSDYGVSYIDGDTKQSQRDQQIRQFQSGLIQVFVGQNIACSVGMDGLQHATNRAILVEPDWQADVNYQLGFRVARIGSKHDHAIVQMVALAGTLDEAIVMQNRRETEMVEAVLTARKVA